MGIFQNLIFVSWR